MQKASFITENYIGHSQNLLVMVSWVLYLDCSRWSVPYIYTMQVCTCLNLISGQQQVVNIFGPVLHHGGQLPVLAVQVLLSCLHVLLTLLSLPPHDPGPASAPYTAPGAPLHGPWPRASPGLGWPEEQQEEEGGDRTHDGRGEERKGGLLVIRSTLEDCCQKIVVTGRRRPVTAVCVRRKTGKVNSQRS